MTLDLAADAEKSLALDGVNLANSLLLTAANIAYGMMVARVCHYTCKPVKDYVVLERELGSLQSRISLYEGS